MSMNVSRAVVERLNMRPSMIAPQFHALALSDLQMLSAADPEKENAQSVVARGPMLAAFGLNESHGTSKPFAYADGYAVIPVTGLLINRFGCSWGSWVTGYNFIRSQMNSALADPDVKVIVFDVSSYGGEVAGCFELADDIFAARGQKPLLAVVDSNCYSAAMAVASAADKIIVTPSGGAGSIGVICIHASYEDALKDWGIKMTMIFSGEHKADGNAYQDLPEAVRKEIEDDCHDGRQKFAALVARNRGLDVQVVMATEARSYRAEEALALGLIDAVEPPTKAIAVFMNELSGSDDNTEDSDMSAENKPVEKADATATDTQNTAAQARTEERARIAAITSLPEAANKSKLANHIALNTSMSVDEAKGLLTASADETPAPVAAAPVVDRLAEAMNNSDQPNVGVEGADGAVDKKASAGILANYTQATGFKPGQA